MAKKREITNEERAVIVALRQEGYSIRAIAEKTGVTHPTVLYTLRRKTETGSNSSRSRSGRPLVTTKHEDKFICVSSKRERTRTAPDLRAELNGMRNTPVSTSTVQRRLREYGLMGRIAVKKPFLRKQNKIKRLGWARNGLLSNSRRCFSRMSPNLKFFEEKEEYMSVECVANVA